MTRRWVAGRRAIVLLITALAGTGAVSSLRATSSTPVLVELFTSEGCSSCPPADDLLARLLATQPVEGARIVALGEHVDYWDQLGWKDRFSSAAFTSRQQDYASRLSPQGAYTPQLVVDGQAECVGSDQSAARRVIAKAAGAPHGDLAIATHGPVSGALTVSVTASRLPQPATDRADILLAITEDHLQTHAKGGENRGRTLSHVAVVRRLTTIGEARGAAGTAESTVAIPADWQRDRLNVVAFVQQHRRRGVLASAIVPLVPRP